MTIFDRVHSFNDKIDKTFKRDPISLNQSINTFIGKIFKEFDHIWVENISPGIAHYDPI